MQTAEGRAPRGDSPSRKIAAGRPAYDECSAETRPKFAKEGPDARKRLNASNSRANDERGNPLRARGNVRRKLHEGASKPLPRQNRVRHGDRIERCGCRRSMPARRKIAVGQASEGAHPPQEPTGGATEPKPAG